MSRGLGTMQRRILDALRKRDGGDEVRQYRGIGYGYILAPGVHDMRQVSYELAVANGGISHCQYRTSAWEASFARALTGLIAKGYVEAPSMVPVIHDELGKAHRLSDGLYLPFANRHQNRFVRVLDKTAKDA
jgi:hypothetical protein